MRQVNRSGINRGQRASTKSFPAPIGGWNARDSLAEMQPTEAPLLTNLFPSPSSVGLRNGCTAWATGFSGQVNTIMPYSAGSNKKLFAASGSAIYDATANGAIGAASLSGLLSDKWAYSNISTPGGQFLFIVNGNDAAYYFNGTTWTASAITGVTSSTLKTVTMATQRLWFTQNGTLVAWYLPIQSIAGAAASFDLGPVFKRGGYLVDIGVWSVTGGMGAEDLTVFLSSEGEIAVYQGIDPSQASSWNKVGTYFIGAPVGMRPFSKFGTDLLVLTQTGLVSMSKGQFFGDVSGEKTTLTDKIQWAISSATTSYFSNYGWTITSFPNGNALLINIPVSLGSQQQYVMNTATGAWCNFSGWNANHIELFNNNLYFAGNGTVYRAWYGNNDAGNAINGECIQAFSDFGASGYMKVFSGCRPVISAGGFNNLSVGIALDYDISQPLSTPTFVSSAGATWGSSTWGYGTWTSGSTIAGYWFGLTGIAYNAALHMKVQSSQNFSWASTDFTFEVGAVRG